MTNKPRFLDLVRERIIVKYYHTPCRNSYASQINRFILFHNERHAKDMSKTEMALFLIH